MFILDYNQSGRLTKDGWNDDWMDEYVAWWTWQYVIGYNISRHSNTYLFRLLDDNVHIKINLRERERGIKEYFLTITFCYHIQSWITVKSAKVSCVLAPKKVSYVLAPDKVSCVLAPDKVSCVLAPDNVREGIMQATVWI